MRARSVDKVILHLAVGANTVGLGVVLALLAELQDAYDLPTAGLGLIAGSSFLAAFCAYLGLSRFADRGHAKTMLVAGSLVGAAALILTAYAQSLWLFVVARAYEEFGRAALFSVIAVIGAVVAVAGWRHSRSSARRSDSAPA